MSRDIRRVPLVTVVARFFRIICAALRLDEFLETKVVRDEKITISAERMKKYTKGDDEKKISEA